MKGQTKYNNQQDWLTVLHSPTLELHIRPAEFATSVNKYRLAVPVFFSIHPVTTSGDHGITSCGNQRERMARLTVLGHQGGQGPAARHAG